MPWSCRSRRKFVSNSANTPSMSREALAGRRTGVDRLMARRFPSPWRADPMSGGYGPRRRPKCSRKTRRDGSASNCAAAGAAWKITTDCASSGRAWSAPKCRTIGATLQAWAATKFLRRPGLAFDFRPCPSPLSQGAARTHQGSPTSMAAAVDRHRLGAVQLSHQASARPPVLSGCCPRGSTPYGAYRA
jgi:hypothetical protein